MASLDFHKVTIALSMEIIMTKAPMCMIILILMPMHAIMEYFNVKDKQRVFMRGTLLHWIPCFDNSHKPNVKEFKEKLNNITPT